ncbi:lamin tail domain-containing protein, partial [Arcanobacterium canis]
MKMKFIRAAALSGGVAVLLTPFVAPMAGATKDATKVVINEVYTFGGTKSGVYPDFVELYNPTNSPVKLDGMTLVPASASGKTKTPIQLKGSIGAKKHFLIVEKTASGHRGQKLPKGVNADMEVTALGFAKSGGIAVLADSGVKVTDDALKGGDIKDKFLDVVGISSNAKAYEGSPAKGTAKSSRDDRSYQREEGRDTDDNSKDFTLKTASPQGSGTAAVKPSSPAPEPEADPQD